MKGSDVSGEDLIFLGNYGAERVKICDSVNDRVFIRKRYPVGKPEMDTIAYRGQAYLLQNMRRIK